MFDGKSKNCRILAVYSTIRVKENNFSKRNSFHDKQLSYLDEL